MTNLESRLKYQPKYKIGQVVNVKIQTKDEKTGFSFENEVKAFISVIKASGSSLSDTYEYGVTTDMPGCYHVGKSPFMYIYEDDIVLSNEL